MKILFFAAALVAQHNAETRFKEMQDDGTIVYEGQDEDTGKALYMVTMPDSSRYHYAYEAEVIQYLKTGTFQYNDFLK